MNQLNLLHEISENSSLNQIQAYIRKILDLRGFSDETIQETMLLLLEETGELAKAIRKTATNMSVDVDNIFILWFNSAHSIRENRRVS